MIDLTKLTYGEIYARATYGVIRSNRGKEAIEASGLSLAAAKQKAAELSKAEAALHPEQTTWTRDMFIPQLERSKEIHAELARRRMERVSRKEDKCER